MKVSAVRSNGIYSKIMSAPPGKKNDIYRYEKTGADFSVIALTLYKDTD